ncbi:MAG: tetraacyldisaccharide 4'-kinase [Candidatus Aminicenantes bacterium]|nr:MAG: tetraacyldisaccharide 4'-kinase [Candidatus Aminicenantes bacterium]
MYIKGNSPVHRLTTWLLNAVSIIFKTLSLINLKRKSLRQKRYPEALIISIDNLSFGGTGKTTLVIEIGKYLEKEHIKFAVVTRGYKSKLETPGAAVQPNHSIEDIGDEAKLFKHRFPQQDIYVGKNRQISIEKAINDNNKIILLDDGFQTTNIYKDIKIMLFNPRHPYYFLRNFKFLLKKEDYVFFYRYNGPYPFDGPNCGSYDFQLERFYSPGGKAIDIGNASLMGFSALGDNLRFKNDLSLFPLKEFKGYSDHHFYTEADIKRLNQLRIQKKADYLVCTEKDFMKIKHLDLTQIPLIYTQNSIKFSFDLMECIWKYAEKKDKIETPG